MSKRPISSSRTDWARLNASRDEDIDLSEIPEVTEEQAARAKLRVGGQFALSAMANWQLCRNAFASILQPYHVLVVV